MPQSTKRGILAIFKPVIPKTRTVASEAKTENITAAVEAPIGDADVEKDSDAGGADHDE